MNAEDAEKLAACEEASAAVIVAHPDDETLWAGGMILMHPRWRWTVTTLCRRDDPDRAAKFARVMAELHATGRMADLDDGPDQRPLAPDAVEQALLPLLPDAPCDLILTHSPRGEYTRHRRHEEIARGVAAMWQGGRLRTRQLWMFAHDDNGGRRRPGPIPGADLHVLLPEAVYLRKRSLITELYGFGPDSFEAGAGSRGEAFWCFDSPRAARRWIRERGERE